MKGLSFFATLFWCVSVAAAIDVSSLYRVYDDGVTVVKSPHLDGSFKVMNDRGTVSLGFAQDILSSGSSDVKSYGTRAVIEDTRTEGAGTFSMEVEDGSLGWSYIRSQENDYLSNIYAFAGTRDFFEKNTTLFMSFSYGEDRIRSSADKSFEKPMTHETFSLALTQVLGQKSVAQLLYDFRVESGYLASPYRRARQNNADGTVTLHPENHPLTRNRNSVALKYNYFWSPLKVSTANTLRFYFDSWSVLTGTIEERITRKFGAIFDLAFNLRYYYQKEASFYRDKYDELGPFHTGNKTLATYDSYLIGIRPTVNISKTMQFYAKYEIYTIRYKNHTDIGRPTIAGDEKSLEVKARVVGAGFEGTF